MAITHPFVYTDDIYMEYAVTSSKIFYNNTTQAVRLPKAVAFPDGVSEVEIVVEGSKRILIPKTSLLDWMLEGPGFSEDFSTDSALPAPGPRAISWDD
jgi:antitoxin VapB